MEATEDLAAGRIRERPARRAPWTHRCRLTGRNVVIDVDAFSVGEASSLAAAHWGVEHGEVAVATGHADGPDEGGGEASGSFSVGGIHFRVLVSLRDFCVDAAYRRGTRGVYNFMFIKVLREHWGSP